MSLLLQNKTCVVVFMCFLSVEDWPGALSIMGIAPESSSLRVNYFIRAVTEREREQNVDIVCAVAMV